MARLRSFITLLWFVIHSMGMPLADDDGDGDDDECESEVDAANPVHVPDSPPVALLAPYEQPPTPHSSPSQLPHATVPVSHPPETPTILGSAVGIVIALVAFGFVARYFVRRDRPPSDPFRDPPKSRFAVFRIGRRSTGSKKRLSDESWVSPTLPMLGSPVSPLSHDLELGRYAIARRKLVPVTTPVCTPTDTEFGSRFELGNGDPGSTLGSVVRVPSPVYFLPFSPSPSPSSSSSSSLSPAPSVEPLTSPSPDVVRLSRLLSTTFGMTRVESPARPTTAYLIDTARSYAHAYRPSSATASVYTPPGPPRDNGARSRTSFYPVSTVRDTFSTVTTDTDTVDVRPSGPPVADPGSGQASVLKLRLSDASEHAQYRLREKEREQARVGFKLRDSEGILRELGW